MSASSTVSTSSVSNSLENKKIVELKNVSKSFSKGGSSPVTVLDKIDLEIGEGEMLALLGQSGSGKSTILRLMAGLAVPTSGEILRHGKPLVGVNKSLSIVFQSFALFPWLTVYENVRIGLINQPLNRQQEKEAIENALELIGLSGYENAYPKELSGGMRQRVGIARAVVAKPEILCMDEAFSALDVLTAENLRTEVVNLWQQRKGDLRSIFFVTHNIAEAVFMANRIVIISSHPGRVHRTILNPLPYPRDVNSKEFQALVDLIHDTITSLALPDQTGKEEEGIHVSGRHSHAFSKEELVTSHDVSKTDGSSGGAETIRRPIRVEAIPTVSVGRIVGLLEILEDSPETVDIFELSTEVGQEFGQTISIVKAAEMLELVETPKHDVHLSELGRKFLAADQSQRKEIFGRQITRLRLFHLILDSLNKSEDQSIDADIVLDELAILLPYDQPEKLFDTLIAWGRYAEILNYDQDSHTVFLPEEEGKRITS